MELTDKIKSTKLGVAAAAIAALYQLEADPWTIVTVAACYMLTNAIQTIGTKKNE